MAVMSTRGWTFKSPITQVHHSSLLSMSTHHVELGRGPLDGAVAAARGEHDDEDAEAAEKEGQAGGDVAVQVEVPVQLQGDPKASKQKDGPGCLRGRSR